MDVDVFSIVTAFIAQVSLRLQSLEKHQQNL